jgi:hypothetical protein
MKNKLIGLAGRLASALLAGAALLSCDNLPGGKTEFVAVEGIAGVPVKGVVGREIPLGGATVFPADAANATISWSYRYEDETEPAPLADGDGLVPEKAGNLTLIAEVADGKGDGLPWTGDFTVSVSADRKAGVYLYNEGVPGFVEDAPKKLEYALDWIADNAKGGEDYLILLDGDEIMLDYTIAFSKPEPVGLTLEGLERERTIAVPTSGNLFTVKGNVTLTLENNITLKGGSVITYTSSLLNVTDGARLVMEDGSKISGHKASNSYGTIRIENNGKFTMNGGEISGNKYVVELDGKEIDGIGYTVVSLSTEEVTMNGGKIQDNNTRGLSATNFKMTGGYIRRNHGGVGAGSMSMTGGVISGNTVAQSSSSLGSGYSFGGGLILGDNGYLSKTGGVIYGSNEKGFDEDGGTLANSAVNGSAVFATRYTYQGGIGSLDDYKGAEINNTVGEDHDLFAYGDTTGTVLTADRAWGWYEEE